MKWAEAITRASPRGSEAARERESVRAASLEHEVVRLYDRYRQPLFRYLRSRGLADADCDEVIQETFLALFQHLLAGRPQQNLQAWLFTVSRNHALKRAVLQGGEVELVWAAQETDATPDPEQSVVRSQQTARIAAVVRALPEQDRECLVLRSEGLPYREIAAMQGRSLAAVAMAIKRALARIAEVASR
jgi:RNA polymerase sigma-70 factor, ECF subfamily